MTIMVQGKQAKGPRLSAAKLMEGKGGNMVQTDVIISQKQSRLGAWETTKEDCRGLTRQLACHTLSWERLATVLPSLLLLVAIALSNPSSKVTWSQTLSSMSLRTCWVLEVKQEFISQGKYSVYHWGLLWILQDRSRSRNEGCKVTNSAGILYYKSKQIYKNIPMDDLKAYENIFTSMRLLLTGWHLCIGIFLKWYIWCIMGLLALFFIFSLHNIVLPKMVQVPLSNATVHLLKTKFISKKAL